MKKASDWDLIQSYGNLKNVWKVAEVFGMCGQSVWERLSKRGIIINDKWTQEQDEKLKLLYKQRNPILSLEEIGRILNRSNSSIACRGNQLGLTDYSRPSTEDSKKSMSITAKNRILKTGHPRGMLGKNLSKEAKEKISIASRKNWQSKTEEQINLWVEKGLKTKGKNGTLVSKSQSIYSMSKKGKREDLNGMYFRSKPEANYARYLNFIKHEWEYEPKTFYFDGIKRGSVSYTPDFYDKTNDLWIELKGWFQPKAITKIKRFKKYYPDEFKKLKIVTQSNKTFKIAIELDIPFIDSYDQLQKRIRFLIPNWE